MCEAFFMVMTFMEQKYNFSLVYLQIEKKHYFCPIKLGNMAFANIYEFVKDYAYGKNGIKVNEKKQRIVIRSATLAATILYWILGLVFLGIGFFLLYGGSAVGLLGLIIALVFLVGLTKRTVFDIGKKEIRQELFGITTASTDPESVKPHITAVHSRGRISSYVFGLEYGISVMKGITAFEDYEDLQLFQGMVMRVLREMKGSPNP